MGIGHWALGIGHWALGIGHWALVVAVRCVLCTLQIEFMRLLPMTHYPLPITH